VTTSWTSMPSACQEALAVGSVSGMSAARGGDGTV
jgi:hypothetical protein